MEEDDKGIKRITDEGKKIRGVVVEDILYTNTKNEIFNTFIV